MEAAQLNTEFFLKSDAMSNRVTNKIKAASHIIEAVLNDEVKIDFDQLICFAGEPLPDGISYHAEVLAELLTSETLVHRLDLGILDQYNRQKPILERLSDDEFDQLVKMLQNFRQHGFLHKMDFARKCWGTKWNAWNSKVDLAKGTATFDTAWTCPFPVFIALSKKFPDHNVEVEFADEDTGSNCGTFTLKAGEYVFIDIAPPWDDQTDEERAEWKAFAYGIGG